MENKLLKQTTNKKACMMKIRKASLRVYKANDLPTLCRHMAHIYRVWNCIVSQCVRKQKLLRAVILRKRLVRFLAVCEHMKKFTSQFADHDAPAGDEGISYEGLMAAFLSLYINVMLLSRDLSKVQKRVDVVRQLLYLLRQWPEKVVDALLGVTVLNDRDNGATFRTLIWRAIEEAGSNLTKEHYMKLAILIKRWAPLIVGWPNKEIWAFLWKIPVPVGMERFLKKKLRTVLNQGKYDEGHGVKNLLRILLSKCHRILLKKMDVPFKRALNAIISLDESREEAEVGGSGMGGAPGYFNEVPGIGYLIDSQSEPSVENQNEQALQLHEDVDELIKNSEFIAVEEVTDSTADIEVDVQPNDEQPFTNEDRLQEDVDVESENPDKPEEQLDSEPQIPESAEKEVEDCFSESSNEVEEVDFIETLANTQERNTREKPLSPDHQVVSDCNGSSLKIIDDSLMASPKIQLPSTLICSSSTGPQNSLLPSRNAAQKNVSFRESPTCSKNNEGKSQTPSSSLDNTQVCLFETPEDPNDRRPSLSVTPCSNESTGKEFSSVSSSNKRSPPRFTYERIIHAKKIARSDSRDVQALTTMCIPDSTSTGQLNSKATRSKKRINPVKNIERSMKTRNLTLSKVAVVARGKNNAENEASEQPNNKTPVRRTCTETFQRRQYQLRSSTAKQRYSLRSVTS